MNTLPIALDPSSRMITERIVYAAKRKLSLSDANCYASVAPAYLESQDQFVVQVSPGQATPYGKGQGGQEGGILHRQRNWTLTAWYRCKFDIHGYSEQALIEAYEGLLDKMELIRAIFALTQLGDQPTGIGPGPRLLSEPLWWVGESVPAWYDQDSGVVRQDITYRGCWGIYAPTAFMLVEEDFADMRG